MTEQQYFLLKYLMENGKTQKFNKLLFTDVGFQENDIRSSSRKGFVDWIKDDVTLTARGIEALEEYEKTHGVKTYVPVNDEEMDSILMELYGFCFDEGINLGRVFSEEEYEKARRQLLEEMNERIHKAGFSKIDAYEGTDCFPVASVENLKRIAKDFDNEFILYHDGHFVIMMDIQANFWDKETAKQKIEEYKK